MTRLTSGVTFCTGGKDTPKRVMLSRAVGRPLRGPLGVHAKRRMAFRLLSGLISLMPLPYRPM